MDVIDDSDERKKGLWLRLEEHLSSAQGAAWMGLGVIWLFLSCFLGIRVWGPWASAFEPLQPNPEAAALLVLVGIAAALKRRPSILVCVIATVVLVPWRLLRICDDVMEQVLGRHFVLGTDSPLLWEAFIVADDHIDRLTLIGMMSASMIVFVALLALTMRSLQLAYACCLKRSRRIALWSLAGVLTLAHLATGAPFSGSLIVRSGSTTDPSSATGYSLPNAGPLQLSDDADVYVLFVESYGMGLFSDPARRAIVEPAIASVQQAFEAAQVHACTAALEPPVHGALPWLSTASFDTGMRLRSFDDLAGARERNAPSIATHLSKAGYRTLRVVPGRTRERPELELPGFGQTLFGWDLGFSGPRDGGERVPDQYALDTVWRREIDDAEQPILLEYVFAASAPPFDPLPPIIEDWSKLTDPAVYLSQPWMRRDASVFSLDEASEPWARSIEYVFRIAGHFVVNVIDGGNRQARARRRRASPLVLIIGTQAPPVELSGSTPTSVPGSSTPLTCRPASQ